MKIFGKRLSEYIGFQRIFLLLILVVGLLRLALSVGDVSISLVKWFSITGLMLIGFVYYSIRVHTSGFGSYKQLLAVLAIQWALAQAIIIGGIALAIFSGKDNAYSIPEYSGGSDGKTWFHALAHLVVIIVGTLVFWGVGSALMFFTKKMGPAGNATAADS
ncbi:MAG: hypothetical protein L0229_26855 [Blastocatellia bacterium]|nr:hypothetical protein [Blastocatellia bacterium]